VKLSKNFWHSEGFQLAVSTVVLGLVVGCSSGILGLFLEGVEKLFLGFVEEASNPSAIDVVPWRRLVSVVIGGIVAALIWWVIRNKTRSVTKISRALDDKQMPVIPTTIHIFTQIFYVGTGGSIGREVAPREAGAMLAQVWMRILGRIRRLHLEPLSAENRRLHVAAAAGAGIAGVYIAPLTGMFFSVEILLKKFSVKNVLVSLFTSIIAMLIGGCIRGFQPYYLLGEMRFFSISNILSSINWWMIIIFAVVLGVVCGFLGEYFRKATAWAENHQTTDKHILWQLPLAALVTGLIAMVLPQIMGNGRALSQFAINTHLDGQSAVPLSFGIAALLLVGALAKWVMTVATIKSGASGGILTPSIAIGACIGAFFALVFGLVASATGFQISGVEIGLIAVLGAVSFLAASQHAPLMALFMLTEVCQMQPVMFPPMLFAVLVVLLTLKVMGKLSAITVRSHPSSGSLPK
jgi:H+/Cl- antiporter ClcA